MDDSIFSEDAQLVESNKDILSISQSESMKLEPGELAYLKAKSRKTTDIETAAQLRRRIAEFVHVNSWSSITSTLADVNRRFHRLATRFKTPCSDVVQQLEVSGHVVRLDYRSVNALYSGMTWKTQQEFLGKDAHLLLPRLMGEDV